MCKRKVSNFYFFFIIHQGKQHKMFKRLNIHRCSYQVKKQCYHMNGVCVFTVKSAASVERVRFMVTELVKALK